VRAAAAARQENMGLGGATRETPKLAEAGRDARTEFKVSAGQFPVLSVHFHLCLCTRDRDFGEQGHTKLVQALGWNCDGTKLASASAGSDVRVWSVETHKDGKEVVLEDHKQGIDGLSWSPTSPDVSSARLQLVSARCPVTRLRTHPPAPCACTH
jgi:WD40 repeat protein